MSAQLSTYEPQRLPQVLKYPGSKWQLAPLIAALLPMTAAYLEPFAGSAAVLLERPRSAVETLNDVEGHIVNLFRVLRDPLQNSELADLLEFTPYSRDEYEFCNDGDLRPSEDLFGRPLLCSDPVESARRYLVRSWQSHGSSGAVSSGWARTLSGVRRMRSRGWLQLPDRVRAVCDRLSGVEVENRDAIGLLAERRCSNVAVYLDPPYPTGVRGGLLGTGRRLYTNEYSTAQHLQLLEAACSHPGPVALSSYRNDMYDQALTGWECLMLHGRTDGGRSRTEALYRNPHAVALVPADCPGVAVIQR